MSFRSFVRSRLIPSEIYTKILFRRYLGYELDLDSPVTLNQKLQWMKLRGPRIIPSFLVDKLEVRFYIESKIGTDYLIPLLRVYDEISMFNLSDLDQYPFIVKPTHDCGMGIICMYPGQNQDKAVKNILARRLSKNYFFESKEYPYKFIPPRIIVETLLLDDKGQLPTDYKFHFFGGVPKFVYCSIDRLHQNKRQVFDLYWRRLDLSWSKSSSAFDLNEPDIERPKDFDLMVELGTVLAANFPYIRVDMYNVDGKIYIGELTFFQGSGFDRFTPPSVDLELGALVDIELVKTMNAIDCMSCKL